jgi:hypothetical protein
MVVRLGVSDGRIVQELRQNHATAYGRHLQKLFTQRGSTCTEFIYSFRLNHLARFLDRRAPTPRRRVTLETAQCALVPKRVRPGLTTSSLERSSLLRAGQVELFAKSTGCGHEWLRSPPYYNRNN